MIAERTRAVINTLSVSAANEGTRTMLTELVPAFGKASRPTWTWCCWEAPRTRSCSATTLVSTGCERSPSGPRGAFSQTSCQSPGSRGSWGMSWSHHRVLPASSHRSHKSSSFPPTSLPSCQVLAGEGFVGARHRLYYGSVLRTSLRRARVVLPISAFVGQGLVHELGIDERRVTSMPLGVVTRVVSDQPTTGAPMVLFVGTLYEYKEARTALGRSSWLGPGSRMIRDW